MVTAESASMGYTPDSDYDGWAQSGYGQFAADSPFEAVGFHSFAQYTLKCRNAGTCGNQDTRTGFLGSVGASHNYKVYLSAADNHIHMLIDNYQILETNYNPYLDWDSEWAGQYSGEVIHLGSDIPGIASDATTFHTLQKYGPTGALNFFQQIYPKSSGHPHFHTHIYNSTTGGKAMNIWTDPL